MNCPRKYFIVYTIWLFAAIKGRINFLQLKRFGKFCEFLVGLCLQCKVGTGNLRFCSGGCGNQHRLRCVAFKPLLLVADFVYFEIILSNSSLF